MKNISDGIENVQELHGVMSYHPTCYQSFADITKLERARKIAASAPSKSCSTSTDERGDPAEKVHEQLGNCSILIMGMEKRRGRRMFFQNAV